MTRPGPQIGSAAAWLAFAGLGLLAPLTADASPPGPADAPGESGQFAPANQAIVNGMEVETCGYASAGSYGDPAYSDAMACSLVLVAPDVVLTAAHCLAAAVPEEVRFGESFDQPERMVPVNFCLAHPEYDGFWADIAFCVLSEDVTDIPITPILSPCEQDIWLTPGAVLDLVGFGATSAEVDDDLVAEGAGIKRTTPNVVEEIFEDIGELWLLGEQNNSACFGDSGGPAFVPVADGQVRVAGVGQKIHPEVPNPQDPCGYGIVYQLVAPHVGWLEANSGRDLTPCTNGEQWLGGPACGGFAVTPELAVGSWPANCGAGTSGPVANPGCATDGGGDDGNDDGNDDDGDDGSGPLLDLPAGDDGDDDPGEADDASNDDDAPDTDPSSVNWVPERSGCFCSARPSGSPLSPLFPLLALPLLARIRRSERPPATRAHAAESYRPMGTKRPPPPIGIRGRCRRGRGT